MKNYSKALIEIGRFIIVTTIAIISGVLFDVSSENSITSVNFNGSIEGFFIALFSIFFLIIIWYKFEIFSSYTDEPKTILLLIATTAAYIGCITISAVLAVDTHYCNPDLSSSKWFSGGLCLLVISDFVLLLNDYRNPNGYISNLTNYQFNHGGFLFGVRFLFAFGYFFFLINNKLNESIDNKYSHLFVLVCSIVLAIYSEIKIFPKIIDSTTS